ncbi:putative alpha/beta-glucosidase agdC [Paramyrothecium foliicola]|nr:putative alpha/beta-glucosidase agdC [Paramyrothecium foliicola]
MHPRGIVVTLAAAFAPISCALEAAVDYSACRGYTVQNVVQGKWKLEADLDLVGNGCAIFGPDVPLLKLLVEYQTDSRVHVLIQDRREDRYQVPDYIFPRPAQSVLDPDSDSEPLLLFSYKENPFAFRVQRRDTGEVLFDTAGTEFIFERQYLRLKTWLPTDPNLYGLGEHTDPFRLFNKDYVRTFWARDSGAVPYRNNLYGSHPVYFEHRLGGTHGVLLMNSNGMDVKLDKDGDGRHFLEYNTIGGVLDFYFLAGPGPLDVSRQYAELIGTPALVPYWSLGFHQCKFGYQDWFHVAEVVHNYSAAGIPLETMWTDIDYMDRRRTFSLDPDRFSVPRMQHLVDYLHKRQQHYIMMVDPAIAQYDYRPYTRGMELGIFMKDKDSTSPYRGVVWPGVTVWPDWTHPNASEYWTERFQETFSPESGVDIDGVWIDMNEPANMCNYPCSDPEREAQRMGFPPRPPPLREPPRHIPGFPSTVQDKSTSHDVNQGAEQQPLGPPAELKGRDTSVKSLHPAAAHVRVDHEGDDLAAPPYKIRNHAPGAALGSRTMSTKLQHANGLWEYDTHNIYGTTMSLFTREAMLNRRAGLRPFVVTRSTFAGAGRYVAKWLGDNVSRWDHYRASISGMLGFASVFQVPMVCGFLGSTNEKLCARWATLGAFQPFYRNHADHGSRPQEFYQWPLVADAAKYAINLRYRLLDYFYTALHTQSKDGTPSINPVWYLYPREQKSFGVDLQYFYGDCILVSPVTQGDTTSVRAYLPDDIFYDLETQKPIRGRGDWVEFKDVAYDRIPLHIRGGCVVPLRTTGANTTTELRKNGFELLVAPGLDGSARGTLYLDDGVSLDGGPNKTEITFQYIGSKLQTSVTEGFASLEKAGVVVDKITVLGGHAIDGDEDWDQDEL